MTRLLLFIALFCPAFASNIDAQKALNEAMRKAANDEVEAQRKATGDPETTSLNAALRNQLGDDWTVKRSGNGYLATRVTPGSGDERKLNERLREFRAHYQEAQAGRRGDEVTLRGRIDDCEDAARAAGAFAGVDGVNKIFLDLSCANR